MPKGRLPKVPTSEIRSMLMDDLLSPEEIAPLVGLCASRIRQIIYENDIPVLLGPHYRERNSPLSDDQKAVALGTLFGDASLIKTERNRIPWMTFCHAQSQLDYLLWKQDWLRLIMPHAPRHRDYHGIVSYQAHSLCHPDLLPLWNLLYRDGRKGVSETALRSLSPLGIAVWYMDDGHYPKRDKTPILSTCAYSEREQEMIVNYFRETWSIETRVVGKKYRRVLFPVKSAPLLFELIEPYIIPSMRYKITC